MSRVEPSNDRTLPMPWNSRGSSVWARLFRAQFDTEEVEEDSSILARMPTGGTEFDPDFFFPSLFLFPSFSISVCVCACVCVLVGKVLQARPACLDERWGGGFTGGGPDSTLAPRPSER